MITLILILIQVVLLALAISFRHEQGIVICSILMFVFICFMELCIPFCL